jgi:hypothetical protein
MPETCCAGGNDVMISACSGGSNVGQLSNHAKSGSYPGGIRMKILLLNGGCDNEQID